MFRVDCIFTIQDLPDSREDYDPNFITFRNVIEEKISKMTRDGKTDGQRQILPLNNNPDSGVVISVSRNFISLSAAQEYKNCVVTNFPDTGRLELIDIIEI